MPSLSHANWVTTRQRALDEIEEVHKRIRGKGRGRRYTTQQINQAYTMLLSSQFQGYCRDLHSECVEAIVASITPISLQITLRAEFRWGRKLETGNPNPGNLGHDFNRFGMKFWDAVTAADVLNAGRKADLEELNVWRNAIGHQDFTRPELQGKTTISLLKVQYWRKACVALAISIDEVTRVHLQSILGLSPW